MPILMFPANRIVGVLDFVGAPTDCLVLATGATDVPGDREISLDIHDVENLQRRGSGWTYSYARSSIDISFLWDLPPDAIDTLKLGQTPTPESLPALTHLAPGLRRLYLPNVSLTDVAIEYIAHLRQLRYLQTFGNAFTDVGVQGLAALTKLEVLYLEEEGLTYAALDFVGKLPRLRDLGLEDLAITPAELAELRYRVPTVRVDT